MAKVLMGLSVLPADIMIWFLGVISIVHRGIVVNRFSVFYP